MSGTRATRIGVVGFLNTLPLIDGLEHLAGVELLRAVPSRLIDHLLEGDVDVALCSSIDYQRAAEPLAVVPVGLLGCDGPTLTVRLYSRRPVTEVRRVFCDTDSHTSVALLRILLRERYGLDPELVPYDARGADAAGPRREWPETVLLIGDKVVTGAPPAADYTEQLDLGATWREHTGAPFVFALWLARRDGDAPRIRTAAAVLDRQRRFNRTRIATIIHRHAAARGWPADLAAAYLEDHIRYAFTEERLEAVEMFFAKAHEHGLIERLRAMDVLAMREGEGVVVSS